MSAKDENHISYGLTSGRVIFTQDEDYLRMHASGIRHGGIAFCHQQTRSIGQVIAGLLLIWEALEPGQMAGRVEYL